MARSVAVSTPIRLHLHGSNTRTAVKFFFMVTAGAKGGSNFLAAQINQRNCGHDNYHPMARPSVNTPFSPRRPPSAALITKNSFGFPVPGRADAALSMLMMFPKSRAFINNKSDQSALVAKYARSREMRVLINRCMCEREKLSDGNFTEL